MIDHYALSYCGSYNPQSSESHLAPVVHDVFSPRCHHIRGVHRFEAILLELVVTAVAVVIHRQCCAHRDLGADEEDGVLGLGLARAVGGLVTEVDAAAERAVAERVVCVCGVSGEGVGVRRREAWRVRKTRRASKLEYESDVPATLHSAGLNDSVLAPVTCEVVQRHRVELGRVTVFVRVAGHGGVKCGCVVEEELCAWLESWCGGGVVVVVFEEWEEWQTSCHPGYFGSKKRPGMFPRPPGPGRMHRVGAGERCHHTHCWFGGAPLRSGG